LHQFIKIPSIVSKKHGEKLREICDAYLNDEIYIMSRYPSIKPQENLWFEDPLNDRSWRFWVHSLVMVEHLLNGYDDFKDRKYLIKAKEYILDWYKWNGSDSKSDMAWHDHSTAIRLLQVSRFYQSWRNIGFDAELSRTLYEIFIIHGEKLADENFYMPKHNHGIDQDISLYISSIVFNEYVKSEEWKKLSFNRFDKQMSDLFASDGSYLEHSPHYAYLILDRVLQFSETLRNTDYEYYKSLTSRFLKQLDFYISVLQPDGKIPPLGDSENVRLTFHNIENLDIDLKSLIIKYNHWAESVNELKALVDDKVFPEGGYAILKNKSDIDKLTQVTFCCAFHSRVHKHHDDLSFTLFFAGIPLFMDSGKHSYNYKSLERQYIVSARAHNSVIVDNENSQTIRLNIGKSGITSFYRDEHLSFSSGCHCLYPGVVHSRLILYLKPSDILILDSIEGYKNHTFDQNFVINPIIEVEQHGNKFTGRMNNGDVFIIYPIYHSNLTNIIKIRGSEDPIDGWVSLEYNNLVPATAIRFTNEGKSAHMATHIKLLNGSDAERKISLFNWDLEHISFDFDRNHYDFVFLPHRTYASKDGYNLNVQHYDKPILQEAIEVAKSYEYRQKYRAERERKLKLAEMLDKFKLRH